MSMTWFAATDEVFAEVVRLQQKLTGRDPFTRASITIMGPTYDNDRLSELPFFQVGHLDPEVVALLFGTDGLVELDRSTSPDASEQYRPYLERAGLRVYRLAQDASARLAARAASFAVTLAEREEELRIEVAVSEALERSEGDAARPPDWDLVTAFTALLGAAGGGAIFGLGDED
jgi:hypothetical protein